MVQDRLKKLEPIIPDHNPRGNKQTPGPSIPGIVVPQEDGSQLELDSDGLIGKGKVAILV